MLQEDESSDEVFMRQMLRIISQMPWRLQLHIVPIFRIIA
uniref:Uncharacterized protein n=1 Tax=Oryza meridionalis TaxID=40149 RepID=A0A0E0F3Y0_9ORYZ